KCAPAGSEDRNYTEKAEWLVVHPAVPYNSGTRSPAEGTAVLSAGLRRRCCSFNPGVSVTLTGTEPGPEYRDIRCSHSDSLPALLEQLRLSLLISTYQTGHLVVVAARQGRLVLTFHQFDRAMGIAVKPGTISVCTRKEVWFVRDAPDIAAKLEPRGEYSACYLARTAHFTGDIQ